MAATMDLIVFLQTGHVLAGAVRNQTGGAAPAASDLAGSDGLWLRNPSTGARQLVVGSDLLTLASAPLREDVLVTARHFQVVDGLPEAKPELTGAGVALNGTTVTVTLPAAATANLESWVVVDTPTGAVVQKVEIASAAVNGVENLALPNGSYQVLVLVPGYRLRVVQEAVP